MRQKTRVLVVDDSIFFRAFLVEQLNADRSIEVIGTASNAMEAKNQILKLNPDVVSLDIEMPGMSGIHLLQQLMQTNPVRVVLVSAVNMNVFDALSAGAVEFVRKPEAGLQDAESRFIRELVSKIAIAREAKLERRPPPEPAQTTQTAPAQPGQQFGQAARPAAPGIQAGPAPLKSSSSRSVLIALGASTGGTEATASIMKELPANTPGMVIVQHMPPGFTKMYADRLNGLCKMEVREAKNGDQLREGLALIAPGDQQMSVVSIGNNYSVKCFYGEKVSGHCPSVDVLFHSVASCAGKDAVGIILTGMGKDGARGLLEMKQQGAFTIGQNEATCVVYGMPMVAYNIGAVTKQVGLHDVAPVMRNYLNQL